MELNGVFTLIAVLVAVVLVVAVIAIGRKRHADGIALGAEQQRLFATFIGMRSIEGSSYWEYWNATDVNHKHNILADFYGNFRASDKLQRRVERSHDEFFAREFSLHAHKIFQKKYNMNIINVTPAKLSYASYEQALERTHLRMAKAQKKHAELMAQRKQRAAADRKARDEFNASLSADDKKEFKSLRTRAQRKAYIEQHNTTEVSDQALILLLLGSESSNSNHSYSRVDSGSDSSSSSSYSSYDSGSSSSSYSSDSGSSGGGFD